MEAGLTRLDWSAPWHAPLREPGERVMLACETRAPLHQALNDAVAAPVRFVPHDVLAPGEAYERHLFRTGDCPTRANLHDFFNGLVWSKFPLAKSRLNQLHAAEIDALGVGATRGPVRDAITVLDENGALLHAPAPLWDALLARDWRSLFVDLRPLWARARLIVFGHALLEQLTQPRKNLTAHVWCEPLPEPSYDAADAWLAPQLTRGRLAGKPFTPLPVLGIPGWWAENQNFSFYEDSSVFRPARIRRLLNNEAATSSGPGGEPRSPAEKLT